MKLNFIILGLVTFISKVGFCQKPDPIVEYQLDSLEVYENYTVYKGDTFNLKDDNNLINGEGIWFTADSTIRKGIASFVMRKREGSDIIHCEPKEQPDEISIRVKEIFYGKYIASEKEGYWTSYYENGNKRLEINFTSDSVSLPVNMYYKTGELMYKGIEIENDKVLFDKYTKPGLKVNPIEWPKDYLYGLGF
ncbi:MAG: hypothetical protein CMC96_11710 [Flavobacteriales bacterium]|nr:hypothetical protein [Flavobacteriales bacterium]